MARQRAAARERHRARRRAQRGAHERSTLPICPPEVQSRRRRRTTPFVDFPDERTRPAGLSAAIERDLIQRSLERTGGNRNKAAELLRIKRTTLVEKLKRPRTRVNGRNQRTHATSLFVLDDPRGRAADGISRRRARGTAADVQPHARETSRRGDEVVRERAAVGV